MPEWIKGRYVDSIVCGECNNQYYDVEYWIKQFDNKILKIMCIYCRNKQYNQ